MSLTPEKLRAYHSRAKAVTWAPIMASDCATLADAIEIADSSARSDIESFCSNAGACEGGGWWWDPRVEDPNYLPDIEQAQRYLEARGLLVRKPDAPHLITFKARA